MNKITLNDKRYIALGDFNALRHSLARDIIEKYEPDENGQRHMSDYDAGAYGALAHIMTEIMIDEIYAAESPDEIREMHDAIRMEWMRDKFIIVGNDNGENVFFRKYCACGDNGEERPVFTGKVRLAKTWENHYYAEIAMREIMDETGLELKVEPLYLFAMTPKDAKHMLDAIFKDDEPEYHGDGTRAEDEDWEGEE